MSQLKDLFTDYLVNYTNSPKNIYTTETTTVEIPTNRYRNLLLYIDTKKDKNNTITQEEEKPEGFTHWVYSESSDEDPKTTKRTGILYLDKALWVLDMTAAYKRAGLNNNAIKNLIAKNALESGWGRSTLGDYNFGNITTGNSWSGKYIQGKDHDANGKKISLKFRAYDSIDDYVKDEILFLTKLYDFNQGDDFDTFIDKLLGNNSGKRRYAEDRLYSSKVKQVYNSI